MREGDVVAGRWRIVAEAPGEGSVRRWRAVAEDTGEPAEVLSLRASIPADGRRAFVRAHQQLQSARDPALAETLQVVDHARDVAVVRAPLEDATLADLSAPLPPGLVAAIGARLVPAVLSAGAATGGALLPADVGLDARGKPVLAPRGRPLNRIDQVVTRSVAPECFEGAREPDGAAGLYGLGVLLWQLAAGRPFPTRGPGAPPPAPPSTAHHAVSPELDRAILKLLSSDPSARAAALPLLQELASPLEDLRPFRRRPEEVRVTVSREATPAAQPLAPLSGGRIVLPAHDLVRLDPAGISAAAGWAGLPVSVVTALAEAHLPLILEEVPRRSAVWKLASERARETGLPLVAVTGRSLAPLVLASFTLFTVLIFLAVGALILLLGFLPGAAVAFALAALAGVSGAWLYGRSSAGNALLTDSQRAARRIRELTADLDPSGALRPAWNRLSVVRKALAGSDLPVAAASDLRGALKDVERRLLAMAEIAVTTRKAMAGLDAERLRTRLAALDRGARTPDALAERDRLARALADLDEVEARREALRAEARAIEATLEEMGTVLARVSTAGDAVETELAQLVHSARSVRSVATPRRQAEEP